MIALAALASLLLLQDSVYSSARVRDIVARAAESNGAPPSSLQSYRARVETEISFVQSQSDQPDLTLQREQLASDLFWRADGELTQQIVGYRAQTLGASFSGLSFFEVPFIIPTLYADRLDFVRTTGPVRAPSGELLHRRTLHPFAPTRDAVYSFSGGDTVDVVNLPKRTISILRIHVVPRREPARPTLLFEGDIDLDATRFHIVRMQGRLIPTGRGNSILGAVIQGALYVRLENAEYDETYWLPREQRFEAQAVTRIGDARSAVRVISRVIDLVTNDSTAMARAVSADSFPYGRLIVGDMRQMSSFNDWALPMGSLSEGSGLRDFDVYAPQSLQPGAQSPLTFGTRYFSQLLRLTSVEGIYTGGGLTYRLDTRSRARVHAGYAWSEHAVRGGAELAHQNAGVELRVRAERQLAQTADFVGSSQPDPGVTPIIAGPEYDFMDRRIASAIARIGSRSGLLARFEAGRARDANVARHIFSDRDSLSMTGLGDEGTYWVLRADVQHNATPALQSLQPGLGWDLRYDGGAGDLKWHRVEAGATLRKMYGDFTFVSRADAGAVFSDAVPAQQLFDFRNTSTLPGYTTDEVFAGDRALLIRAMTMYSLPVLRSPLRLGSLFLPALAPSPSVGFYSGSTWARPATDAVLDRLGWRVSDGMRASVDLRMRFFGGAVSAGAARPLQHGAPWKFVWGWVSEF